MTGSHSVGTLGRIGRWSALHGRRVMISWAVLVVALGALAPRAEHALSGGGWQADGSQSVRARDLVARHFDGQGSYALAVVVSARDRTAGPLAFRQAIAAAAAALRADPAVTAVRTPRPGASISAGGRVAVVRGGAAAGTAEMVRAAGRVRDRLKGAAPRGVALDVTGAPALWSQFNEDNKRAMLRSEMLSWPLTLAVLVLAFGSLAAAGLPLLLSIAGLVATAGALWLGTHVLGITIWAMNFALMFALAVGIDYTLFVVVRFRAGLRVGLEPIDAVTETMDSAGRAVFVSGLAVLASLSAMVVVPSQPFRTSALGILLAVGFVLAASVTLLPAVLLRLGARIDRLALPWTSALQHRSEAFARWGRLIGRRPLLAAGVAVVLLAALALPVRGLHTAMPGTGVLPRDAEARIGAERLARAFGPGAPAPLQVVAPAAQAGAVRVALRRTPGIARVAAAERRDGVVLVGVQPSGADARALVNRLRAALPATALVGGAPAEARDLERALADRTPLVYGLVVGVGFLLLLAVVRAPLAAALAVLLNLAATAAAFGVARLVFQDGVLGLFETQGFVDAWAPVFFFSLIFALAMDYTVFLLATVREQIDRGCDPRDALVEGMARSGRVINAAGAVMVVVFFTFAVTGVLPGREMGTILGVGVLLDTLLVRLLLLPAALRLLGRWAWWTPAVVDRLLPAVRLDHV